MSDHAIHPGDDGEVEAAPQTAKSDFSAPSDTPVDWYGQVKRKRKNDIPRTSDGIGTRTLIIAASLFIMMLVLIAGAAILVRLSSAPQILMIVTATPAPPTRITVSPRPPSPTFNATYPTVTPHLPIVSATPATMPRTATLVLLTVTPAPIVFYPAFTPVGMDLTNTVQPPLPNASSTLPGTAPIEFLNSSNGIVIQITIRERAPLRITVDNQLVFNGVPIPSQVLNYQAKTSVVIHTGDAGSIDVVVNGVQQPLLGPLHVIADKTYIIAGATLVTNTPVPNTLPAPTVIVPDSCATFITDSALPKIAYETNVAGGWNIYVTDPSGTFNCRLSQPGSPTVNHAYQPAWSMTGRHIAFVSDRANGFQIYTMSADGSNQQPLTNNNVQNYRPAWSPDGSQIAFVEQIGKTVFELHAINADGTNSHLLINDSRASYPAWSPDGSKLVYDSLHNGEDWFYIADGNGNNPVKLFDNGASTSPSHIAWSLDGKRLVFESSRSGRPQVYTANANGTGVTQLTYSKGWNYNACWLPNNQIIFASTRDGHAVIYSMGFDGSNQQPVTHDPAPISDDNPACTQVPDS